MKRIGLILAASLALIITSCGGGEPSAGGGQGNEIEISLFEYQFEPAEIHLTVGETVTLVLTNDGGTDHEFMAGREVHEENGIPHGFEQDFFDTVDDLTIDPPDALETSMEGMSSDSSMGDMGDETTMGDMGDETTMGDMGDEMDMGVMVVRQPGDTATVTFSPTQDSVGEWQIGCFEEEGKHWMEGMKGKIIVDEA